MCTIANLAGKKTKRFFYNFEFLVESSLYAKNERYGRSGRDTFPIILLKRCLAL